MSRLDAEILGIMKYGDVLPAIESTKEGKTPFPKGTDELVLNAAIRLKNGT